MRCRKCKSLTGLALIVHQKETHGISFPKGFSPEENIEVKNLFDLHKKTGDEGMKKILFGEDYKLKSNPEYIINLLREKGLSLTLFQRLKLVWWFIKYYLKRKRFSESWLVIKSFFKYKKYAVWFSQQYDYRINN